MRSSLRENVEHTEEEVAPLVSVWAGLRCGVGSVDSWEGFKEISEDSILFVVIYTSSLSGEPKQSGNPVVPSAAQGAACARAPASTALLERARGPRPLVSSASKPEGRGKEYGSRAASPCMSTSKELVLAVKWLGWREAHGRE